MKDIKDKLYDNIHIVYIISAILYIVAMFIWLLFV